MSELAPAPVYKGIQKGFTKLLRVRRVSPKPNGGMRIIPPELRGRFTDALLDVLG